MNTFLRLSCPTLLALVACTSSAHDDGAESTEAPLISDADSLTRRADGRFDVTCKDGHTEIATVEQIQAGQICNVAPAPSSSLDGSSIWDDAWASTPAATAAQSLSLFPPGESRVTFGLHQSRFSMRYRVCNQQTGCTPWKVEARIYFSRTDGRTHGSPQPTVVLQTKPPSGVVFGCDQQGGAICEDGWVKLINIASPFYVNLNLPYSTAWVRPVVTPTFVYGRSSVHKSTTYNGSQGELQYAFFAKLSPSAPTPVFDR